MPPFPDSRSAVPFDGGFVPTMPNLLRHAVDRHGEREFLVHGDRRLTFRDAERQSAVLARGLLAMGIGKGTRVGLLMPNGPDWILAYLAITRIGALCVTMSTFSQARELSWALRYNDVDTLLVADRYLKNDYVARLEEAVAGLTDQPTPDLALGSHPFLRRILVWGPCDRQWARPGPDSLKDAAAARPAIDDVFLAAVEDNVAPADLFISISTSGTTSEPKVVVHTHGAAVRWVRMLTHHTRLRPEDRVFSGQAYFWVGGQTMNVIPSLYAGCCQVYSDSWDPDAIIWVILREKITIVSFWPPQAKTVANRAAELGLSLGTVRRGLGPLIGDDGQPIPPERTSQMMGMTESFGMHSMESFFSLLPPGKTGTAGRGLPGMERLIVDRDTGRPAPAGALGELYLRGHSLMQGYYKREREEVFTRDGWFATGDIAAIDEDGYIYFNGRSSEMIKTSGANVSPKEVEEVLTGYPEVHEAIVFGLPDPVKGQTVVAVVVPQTGQEVSAEGLRARLQTDMAHYKVPKSIVFLSVDDIPRTPSNKPIKSQLIEMLSRDGPGDAA